MSKKRKEAVVFVVNIGKSSVEVGENEAKSFLDKSKTVIKQVLERKIFLRKGDVVNIICIGANETNNEEGMDYINQMEETFLVPTWTLIQNVLDLQGTNKSSGWVEGLHVALEFIDRNCSDEIRKVILINDFQEDSDVVEQFDAKVIADEISAANTELLIIGKTMFDEEHLNDLNSSEQLALKISKRVNVAYVQIDQFMWMSRFYKNPQVNPTAWKCDLRIGDIIISTETYVKVTEPPPFPSWKMISRDDSVKLPPQSGDDVKKARQLVDRFKNPIDLEGAIKGYKYGGKFIPFSDDDLEATKFKGTEKSLIIRGFVNQKDLSLEYWFGKGSHIIVSRDKSKFYALVSAMKKAGLVAITRKVYAANSIPKMGALFPRMEEGEPVCLVHVSIPFTEERRVVKPRQMVNLPNEERQKNVEDLISAMTLPEDDERFKPGSFCNPCKQYKWDALAHRALYESSLPAMDKALMDLISSPEFMHQKAESALNELAEWVKPKLDIKKVKKEEEENVENNFASTQKEDDEIIRVSEEAENEIKNKDELFNEIKESFANEDENMLNEI